MTGPRTVSISNKVEMCHQRSHPRKTPPKRRSPISRAEGERRLIQAAKQLIREKPFSEVGVRDIALLADVNHGFVHTWFGGKNELLLAVVREHLLALAAAVPLTPPGTPAINFLDPEVVSMVRLVLWLDLEGVDTGVCSRICRFWRP